MTNNTNKSFNKASLYSSKFFPIFLTLVLMFFLFGTSAFIAYQTGNMKQTNRDGKCTIGGCNSELCSDSSQEERVSICIFDPKSACYKNAVCERQVNGKCGWSQTEELTSCLSNSGAQNPDEGAFCGGIAGIACPEGYTCKSDGNFPDAGGKCVKKFSF
ncbi:hypothetical protein A3D01_05855 [Candidatus Woesebacteria bacterium RIFCSPHIGHO2_02_FULL_39_13]|uniref:Uncharacterized protein n=1 Tax=Candidatus Woesebacteria bacterium RIFCSPHIGHO2_02_FULL_39_13 TaxID=1802505 RepID=A0A1F7Z2N7_9BACT|nr:MAG: hypothetical protein A2692_02170 [Candidatus Woesebacteria bacterium RIFCSPHIGHO2_01_FULL_39_95]OGM33916.1 MAG: hypothetical protein A3D01_05855 [Candidatus Woesebacteria bacterium RIFCSPHIGHO2_02_FULL_39_13]OGM37205.1 MAG: hypothetical protein A3E13_03185 [Candidatus Woesebacteria bacterium RIFCSPHIGHO2_12_FULL_40_20]OGM74073.1 MAG: hypothetical protein A3H19_02500 [Candidatus Woesebacteria bacterium RIFCSPLOWO2_12_FULL_39_9]